MPRPLLSEALRGHGALLRDPRGERFVDELLPRDRVSRAITGVLAAQDAEHVWLDATGLDRFADRFPTITSALAEVGLDPAHDWLPVAPAAHYLCGGIVADLDGASSLPGLWVAGEAACNGVHGANRLASNSLLDGMVFGPRVIEAVADGRDGPRATGAMRGLLGGGRDAGAAPGRPLGRLDRAFTPPRPGGDGDRDDDRQDGPEAGGPEVVAAARDRLQRAMTGDAGVLRSAESLTAAGAAAERAATVAAGPVLRSDVWELHNLATVAGALCTAAAARAESRGAHTRVDHPETSPDHRVRYVLGDVPG
jgi:L-aspartate oxidase